MIFPEVNKSYGHYASKVERRKEDHVRVSRVYGYEDVMIKDNVLHQTVIKFI